MLKIIREHNMISIKDIKEKQKAFITLFGVEPYITIELPSLFIAHKNYKYKVVEITSSKLVYIDSTDDKHYMFAENIEYNKRFTVTWYLEEKEK